MTTQEFSSEFDILYNNIMSNKAPGLDEYEKSVFLTKAQLEIVMNHFNPKGNKYQEGIEDSVKRQMDFSEIVTEEGITDPLNQSGYDLRGLVYALPADLLLLLDETFSWHVSGKLLVYQVVPLSFSEYRRLMSKPYKAPLKGQVWRLLRDNGGGNGPTVNSIVAEIIPHRTKTEGIDTHYHFRYVRRPNPIVLTDLRPMEVSVDGVNIPTQCSLNPLIHREILDRAVELAKSAYLGNLQSTVELNTRNE